MARRPPTAVSAEGRPPYEEDFRNLGELLQRDARQIMERWFQRADAEQVHASEKDRKEVMNDLLEMLQAIGNRLYAQSPEALIEATEIARNHGQQRAHFRWGIVSLVKDYEILHGVILEYLGETLKHRLTYRQAGVLVAVLGRAVGSAVEAFDAIVEEHLDEAARTKLEKQVAEQTAEFRDQTLRLRHLAAAVASAEQRERRRLAALLHDDLQQLLVAAKMTLDRACHDDGPALSAFQDASGWIHEATQAARHLTHQLRPPALYEDGLMAALRGLAREMGERHDLRVDIGGEREPERLSDDLKALLFDAVRELLFNVAEHAGVSEAWVWVSTEKDLLRIRIEDRGRGFDAEKVLEMGESTGFNLFSIRERLTAMGGIMSIETRPGAGTSILLEAPLVSPGLPWPEVALEIRDGKVVQAPVEEAGIRIVVADDHAIVREGLITLLEENERFVVVGEARDGIEAIEAVERHRPDVLLLDVNMPRMNGIEAAREIHRRWPEQIVLGLSVQDDETTTKAMCEAGAAALLSKGGDSSHMFSTIAELIANRRRG